MTDGHNMTETVYQFICDQIAIQEPPTIREIASACFVSIGTVMRHLDKLEGQGRIHRKPGRARGITLPADDESPG